MFGRKPRVSKAREPVELQGVQVQTELPDGDEVSIDPVIFNILDRLEKVGAQLLVRVGGSDMYTTTVVGLGHDGFFIDTLTPPTGDGWMKKGAEITLESLLGGASYDFTCRVMSKVRFLDELPAFKLSYPTEIDEGRRRRSPRILTKSTASISFSLPFKCSATVRDISLGGLAFEYDAELGRLANGTALGGALLEIDGQPMIEVYPEVVGNLVVALGGLSLPSRYRTSVSFTRIDKPVLGAIESYIETLCDR